MCRPIIEAATVDRFAFDVELLYGARLAGLNLKEVPMRWDHNEGSKVNFLHDSVRMFGEVRSIQQRGKTLTAKLKAIQKGQHSQQSTCAENTLK